jgi:hypothetical protein
MDQTIATALTATTILADSSRAILCQGVHMGHSYMYCILPCFGFIVLQNQYKQLSQARQKMTDRIAKVGSSNKSYKQSEDDSQRTSSDTTQTTLPSYDSLASDTPPTYTHQASTKPVIEKPTAGASAATLRAIMGDPVPEEPRRSLRDRLLGRRQYYNRRPPSSEREQGSSARWNVWGSPISDAHK